MKIEPPGASVTSGSRKYNVLRDVKTRSPKKKKIMITSFSTVCRNGGWAGVAVWWRGEALWDFRVLGMVGMVRIVGMVWVVRMVGLVGIVVMVGLVKQNRTQNGLKPL